jgi:hypothetical protein
LVFGLNRGIDFTGGAIWDIEFQEAVTTEEISAVMADNGFPEAQVQLAENSAGVEDRVAVIRVKELQQGTPQKGLLEAQMTERIGPFTELSLNSVGSSVSAISPEERSRRSPSLRSASSPISPSPSGKPTVRRHTRPARSSRCSTTCCSSSASSRSLESSPTSRSTRFRDGPAHGHRLLGPRHDRRLRSDP